MRLLDPTSVGWTLILDFPSGRNVFGDQELWIVYTTTRGKYLGKENQVWEA